ncbi:MAG: hypothetical protein H7X70_06490 [Candidatus Kapabacteria bacterium]|nr:hypothetical protein [Candidatus Kapabacteria bacterium]
MRMTTLYIAIVTLLLLTVDLTAGDGPTWKITGLKDAHLPAVSRLGNLFLGTEGNDAVCRAASTGAVLWRAVLGKQVEEQITKGSFIDEKWFVFPTTKGLEALDLASGNRTTIASDMQLDLDDVRSFRPGGDLLGRRNICSVDNVVCATLGSSFFVLDPKTMAVRYRVSNFKGSWFVPSFHSIYVMRTDSLIVINSQTVAASSMPVTPKELYGRVKSRHLTFKNHVTLVAEEGFYTYDVVTGKQSSHIAIDPSDIENYNSVSLGDVPHLVVSDDEFHDVHNLQTGTVARVPTSQFPGVIDRVFDSKVGAILAVSYDSDDSMHLAAIDPTSGKLRWKQTIGWGKKSYYSAHLPNPSGFSAFMYSIGQQSDYEKMERNINMNAMQYDKASNSMQPDIMKQMSAFSSGAADRHAERTMRALLEEARRPVADVRSGHSQRRCYGDADLISVDGDKATILLYGAIFRPVENTADFPDGEGLLTVNMTTGAILNFKHVSLYGNAQTASDFNTTHMADVRNVSPNLRLIFADSAIVYINSNNVTRLSFQSKKIAMLKGKADSMWVADVDQESEDMLYSTIAYDSATGIATRTLIARTDDPVFKVPAWSNSSVGFTYLDKTITAYRRPGQRPETFSDVDRIYVVSEDSLDEQKLGSLYLDKELVGGPLGVTTEGDAITIIGDNGVSFYSKTEPFCHSIFRPEDRIEEESPGLLRTSGGYVLASRTNVATLIAGESCSVKQTSTIKLDSDYKIATLSNGYIFLDEGAGTLMYYRR